MCEEKSIFREREWKEILKYYVQRNFEYMGKFALLAFSLVKKGNNMQKKTMKIEEEKVKTEKTASAFGWHLDFHWTFF